MPTVVDFIDYIIALRTEIQKYQQITQQQQARIKELETNKNKKDIKKD